MRRPFLVVDRGCPWGACLLRVRYPAYVLAVGGNDVVFVGINLVHTPAAVDGVLAARRLVRISVDNIGVVSAANEIGALIALHVIGATFSVELVVACISEQLLSVLVRRR